MKSKTITIISVFFSTIMVSLSGAFLYVLNNGAAVQFKSFNKGFDVGNSIVDTLYASLENWAIILVMIAVVSYLPLFWNKRLLSSTISLICFLSLVAIVYSPILKSGNVI
mgnify:CR=1 FL=1